MEKGGGRLEGRWVFIKVESVMMKSGEVRVRKGMQGGKVGW